MKLKPNQKLIQIIIDDDSDELLAQMAKEDDRSRSSFCRILIRQEYDRRHGGDGPDSKTSGDGAAKFPAVLNGSGSR